MLHISLEKIRSETEKQKENPLRNNTTLVGELETVNAHSEGCMTAGLRACLLVCSAH